MNTLIELSSALQAARREQKLSYKDLAAATGLTVLSVRRALDGSTASRATTLMALADCLGLALLLLPKPVATGLHASVTAHQAPARLTFVDQLQAMLSKP
jgi:transcriptional regulator with XRE-family HTH domain